MKVEVDQLDADKFSLVLTRLEGRRVTHSPSMSEHDLRDLEFALAQRRAMSKHCTADDGEHNCVYPPEHGSLKHQCRSCTHQWESTK